MKSGAPVRELLLDDQAQLSSELMPPGSDTTQDAHRKHFHSDRGIMSSKIRKTKSSDLTDQMRGNIYKLKCPQDIAPDRLMDARLLHTCYHSSNPRPHKRRVSLRTNTNRPGCPLRQAVVTLEKHSHQSSEPVTIFPDPECQSLCIPP
jgi:hypothetical protein